MSAFLRFVVIFAVAAAAVILINARCLDASLGDIDLNYRACVNLCEKTGCIMDQCFKSCEVSSDREPTDTTWYFLEPLYLQWKEWSCRSDCQYHCMLNSEEERKNNDYIPLKYHGSWPFRRVLGIQEPVSAVLSTLNLAMQVHGWLSFFALSYYNLPLTANGKTYYEYTWFWHVYVLLAMNFWLWRAAFHGIYVNLTERLYYSSSVAFIGYSLLLSILRALYVRAEAARVMVAAPVIAFTMTHILFLNLVELNYLLNRMVVIILVVLQLLICGAWAGLSHPPSRLKLLMIISGGTTVMLLAMCDFPPYKGLLDTQAVAQVITLPVTYVLWSFVRDDANASTSTLIKKAE